MPLSTKFQLYRGSQFYRSTRWQHWPAERQTNFIT